MNTRALVADLLDHIDPRAVFTQVDAVLNSENERRAEFRNWLKPDVKAEFILGEVVIHSPAREAHNAVVMDLSSLLHNYCRFKAIGETRVEKALVATKRNDFEPDISVWTKEQAADFNDDTAVYPPPTLVVEVASKSTRDRDYGVKHDDYCYSGVAEYWIVETKKREIHQFLLRKDYAGNNLYEKTVIGELATIASEAFTGFSIPVAALFDEAVYTRTLRSITEG